MKVAIYILCDEDLQPRYVGRSSNPAYRFTRHMRKAPYHAKKLTQWLESMLPRRPTMHIVEWVDELHADRREKNWIQCMQDAGANLVNSVHNARK